MAELMAIGFDRESPGAYVRDYFDGYEMLEDGETFLDRVNATFSNNDIALDWLRKSYKGRDESGVGVLVDMEPL